jgi:hypothetical protein
MVTPETWGRGTGGWQFKGACPVRRGPDGKGAAMPPRRLATLLLKIRGEQRISMHLNGNFLKAYVSIFDFLQ